MTKKAPKERYDNLALFLHWLMALGLLATFALGLYMVALPFSPSKLKLYSWHKWAGISLFALVWLRLAWRWSQPAVPLPHNMRPIIKLAARTAHWLLYGFMVAIPLTGWLASSAHGVPVVWMGWFQLPDLIGKNEALAIALDELHQALNYALLALVVLHVLASLKHYFIDRDSVLYSMLPMVKKHR